MFDRLNNVRDKASFIAFLRELAKDYENSPDEWENGDIPSFLEAIAAWTEDFSESPMNDTDRNSIDYYSLARMLYMGKLYE